MTAVKAITEQEYLKEVFTELEAVKGRVLALRQDLAMVTAGGRGNYAAHDRHLLELAEYIDWKLQVLEKGTSFDWKAAGTIVESVVSVSAPEKSGGPDISGGYLGG
jgi:hypothetical protein